jgi:hypothetical protein
VAVTATTASRTADPWMRSPIDGPEAAVHNAKPYLSGAGVPPGLVGGDYF